MKRTMLATHADQINSAATSPRAAAHKPFRWKKGDLIGEGAYAKVYQCMNIENGELYAIKRYKFSQEAKKVEREFISMRKEVHLLQMLNHPNMVKYV